jgi:hypothetical protein
MECTFLYRNYNGMHSFEILPGLMLGNHEAALDQEFHEDMRYGLVINCTPDIPFLKNKFSRYWRVPVQDVGAAVDVQRLATFMPTLVEHIDKAMKANQTVLVHCAAGRQRSVAVVVAYVMHAEGLSRDEAIAFVKSKKRDAFFPEPRFYDSLRQL